MSQGIVSAKIGPGEAKYVKLSFNITHPGRIAAFGVYATPALSDFTMPRPRKISFEEESATFALITFNFSDLHARARGLYVSSGDAEQANNMIDDQPATSYEFASGDPAPTAVIDLGRERNLTRFSAIYAAQPGSFEFYVLPSLPLGDGTALGRATGGEYRIGRRAPDIPYDQRKDVRGVEAGRFGCQHWRGPGFSRFSGDGRSLCHAQVASGRSRERPFPSRRWRHSARRNVPAAPPTRLKATSELMARKQSMGRAFSITRTFRRRVRPSRRQRVPRLNSRACRLSLSFRRFPRSQWCLLRGLPRLSTRQASDHLTNFDCEGPSAGVKTSVGGFRAFGLRRAKPRRMFLRNAPTGRAAIPPQRGQGTTRG